MHVILHNDTYYIIINKDKNTITCKVYPLLSTDATYSTCATV